MRNFYQDQQNVKIRAHVGSIIKDLRLEHGMSQYDLARYLNISRPAVSKWERELTTPYLFTLIDLSNIFGVSTDTFLEGSDNIIIRSRRKDINDKLDTILRLCDELKLSFNNSLSNHFRIIKNYDDGTYEVFEFTTYQDTINALELMKTMK